jgi:YD repeat-containing protein
VVFIDGLKRILQTKKDATIFSGPGSPGGEDRMIVTGRVTFDFASRVVEMRYPVTEPTGSAGTFNTAIDPVPPTVFQYDVLDRKTKITLPDNTSTTFAFGFGADRSGATQFEASVTDGNGIVTKTYQNVRNLVTSVRQLHTPPGGGAAQELWTSYAYNPLQQLVQVTDPGGNVTSLAYDNLGRRTVVDNPDTGKTEMVYDKASNLVAKVTANLRAQGKQIAYNYDAANRLVTIAYPTFPGNNVTYTYGAPGASDNRAGRITLVQHQAGAEERFYGKLGEMTKEVKTIVGFTGAPPDTYTTQYVYDSFGRLQSLTYPDGEVLTYQYDSGGLLRQATGKKGPNTYPYITRLEYDKFEQQAFRERKITDRPPHVLPYVPFDIFHYMTLAGRSGPSSKWYRLPHPRRGEQRRRMRHTWCAAGAAAPQRGCAASCSSLPYASASLCHGQDATADFVSFSRGSKSGKPRRPLLDASAHAL